MASDNSENKKLGIMQPYFLPYLGYFSLIKNTDSWVVFDISQYVRHSWINRNRIIHPESSGWIYMTVPVKKHTLNSKINDIQIQNDENWSHKIISRLGFYKKNAPYYKKIVEFLHEVFNTKHISLSQLNIQLLEATCKYIGIEFNYQVFSKIDINIEPATEPDQWGVNICKALGYKYYINPEGGVEFFDRTKYTENNIVLKFIKYGVPAYNQKMNDFIPRLSILDALMFNSPGEVNQMLDDFQLLD